jgi:hypothetical protein
MEIIMFPTNPIEETLVRLEERAVELTMSEASPLTLHEHAVATRSAAALRMDLFGVAHQNENIRRLDRIDAELLCIKQRWEVRPQAAA